MEQLLCHLWGDYILQSDWMAQNKRLRNLPCYLHVTLYTAAFLFLTRSPFALLTIFWSHFFIDRYGLAGYLVYAKNWLGGVPEFWSGGDCSQTAWAHPGRMPPFNRCVGGIPPNRPLYLSIWLLIIADNILHLTINYLALRYL